MLCLLQIYVALYSVSLWWTVEILRGIEGRSADRSAVVSPLARLGNSLGFVLTFWQFYRVDLLYSLLTHPLSCAHGHPK